jgi:hypothetical protein
MVLGVADDVDVNETRRSLNSVDDVERSTFGIRYDDASSAKIVPLCSAAA